MNNERIQVGCCGWSYDDWLGPFYQPGTRAGDFLAEYAKRFPIVEVDSTFYRTPSRRMVEGWREKTPPGFRFCLKAPQVVTHDKMMQDCEEELDGFLSVVRLLGEKLHSVCLQFGYFNKAQCPSVVPFLKLLDTFLDRWPKDIPVAVEIRNRNWVGLKYADCLRAHGAAMVMAVQSWMPSLNQVMEQIDPVTGPFSYVRLLGDRKGIEKLTETWDKIVVDKMEETKSTAAAIQQLSIRVPVVAFVNNHYAGNGPQTAESLIQFIDEIGG